MSDPLWGFRWRAWDLPVLLTSAALALALQGPLGPTAWLVVLPVAHFFLFCDVFRVPTRLELVWVACFVANVAGWQLAGGLSTLSVLLTQLPITAGVIGWTMRSPLYRGVLADRINPDGVRALEAGAT